MNLANPKTPRPGSRDDFIMRAAAQDLAPEVQRWSKAGNGDDNLDQITVDLRRALDRCIDLDGYQLARELDRIGWEADAELVEIMDGASGAVYKCHKAACIEWVQIEGMQPPLIGAAVRIADERVAKRRNAEGLVGNIVANHPEGTSTVSFKDLGHSEKPGPGGGIIGFVLPWEELK